MMTESGIVLPENYSFFVKPNEYEITNRRLEEHKRTAEFIQWGRRNPCIFAEEIFGISFMDYQKYVFMMTWNTPYVVWCMGRNSGKSILGAIYLMTRSLLVPYFNAYILCGVGSQSIELFSKIEKLTFNALPSFKTLTDVFAGEVTKNAANSNGFTHNPASYQFHLYNQSAVYTLNGAYDNNRSKRSNCNFYDECMNSPDELFETSEPFCTQSSEFGDGVGYDATAQLIEPLPFANQLIYASSAGRTDQYFYKKYRECSLRMDAGDKRYFCADISADMVIKATKGGVLMAKPLLTQEVVDARMRADREAGLREYANIFTSEGGEGQIIRRADIIRNSVPRVPLFANEDNTKLYSIAYDPARQRDDSAVVTAEYYFDDNVGWKMKFVNAQLFTDILKKNKTPMTTPNQIKALKKIIVNYNGEQVADYENIISILVDAGSGGAGVPITDFLCEDFEVDGVMHRGLVDPEFNEGDDKKFPNAVRDKLRLIPPKKYKSELFEAMIKMMEENLIEFTEEYNDRGYVNLIYEVDSNGKKNQRYNYPSEKEEKELKKKGISIEVKPYHLDRDQELGLSIIDKMKDQVVNIYRFKRDGTTDRFDLAPEKADKMHDDLAYCAALLSWQLAQLRREPITKRKKPKKENVANLMPIRKGVVDKAIG